jgi:hypothetical protein
MDGQLMAAITHDVSMPRLVAQLQVRVRFHRIAGARLWLGARLMRLAAWVVGCGVTIDTGAPVPSMAGKGSVPVSYDVRSPGYDNAVGIRLRISLDGVEMRRVVAYDIAAGTIERHVTTAAGRPVLTADRTAIAMETLTGEVEVDWVDAEAS